MEENGWAGTASARSLCDLEYVPDLSVPESQRGHNCGKLSHFNKLGVLQNKVTTACVGQRWGSSVLFSGIINAPQLAALFHPLDKQCHHG